MVRRAKPVWLTPTRVVGAVVPGVGRVAATVEGWHRRWDEANAAAARARGPLWIALGDSSQVGVGASRFEATSVALGLARLRNATGEPWRVINLARHGVKLSTVVQTQVSRIGEWGEPALVTVGAGANDVLWSFGLAPALDGVDLLLRSLPAGAVAGTIPLGWTGKGHRVNDHLRVRAPGYGVHVSEAGVMPPGRAYRADDRLHPNDAGYRFIADRFWDTVGPLVGATNPAAGPPAAGPAAGPPTAGRTSDRTPGIDLRVATGSYRDSSGRG
jgi:lysophospholipase L1-like esterase